MSDRPDKGPDLDRLRAAPDEAAAGPMAIVEDPRLDYAERLRLLQHWLARIAEGSAPDEAREEVEAAILALQARARLREDEARGTPEVHGYGVVEGSDLRRYSVSALAQRMWRFLHRER
jgi:hypothetical protein